MATEAPSPPARVMLVHHDAVILSALRKQLRIDRVMFLTMGTAQEAIDSVREEPIDVLVSPFDMSGTLPGQTVAGDMFKMWPSIAHVLLVENDTQLDAAAQFAAPLSFCLFLVKPWYPAAMKRMIETAIRYRSSEKAKTIAQTSNQQNSTELQTLKASLTEKINENTGKLEKSLAVNQETYEGLRKSYLATVKAFATLIAVRRAESPEHISKVADYALLTAQRLNLPQYEIDQITIAAWLHSISHIILPLSTATEIEGEEKPKPSARNNYDYIAKHHADFYAGLLNTLQLMPDIGTMIRSCHEYWDGTGFPDKLKGEAIPLGARVICLAKDFIDAQEGCLEPKKMTPGEAAMYIKRNRAVKYDHQAVDAFLTVITKPLSQQKMERTIRRTFVSALRAGQVVAKDICSKKGMMLLSGGHALTTLQIERLDNLQKAMDEKFEIFVFAD